MSVRLKFNGREFEKLRRDPAVVADLVRRGTAVKDHVAGEDVDDYELTVHTGKWVGVSVRTDSFEARWDQAKDATLLYALDAGRE